MLVLILVCSLPTVPLSAPNAFVGNNGQFDNEVDSPGSECSEDPQEALRLRAEMMGRRSLSTVTVLMFLAVCPLPQSDGILRCALRGSSARMFHFYALQDHTKMNVAFVGNPGHFHNEIDLAGSECLDGKKIVKFTPWKIISSSPLGTPRLCRHMVECTNWVAPTRTVSTYCRNSSTRK